jgi:aarF domain-containing kinase
MSHASSSASTLEEDIATILEDTGVSVGTAFREFESQPVASASLAQVYRATLLDGSPVAVKVQRRAVARHLRVDLLTIELFYDLIARLIPGLRLGWLAVETRRHMVEELNFVAERANAEEAQQMLGSAFPRSVLVIPRLMPELCGSRVLTMEWVEGVRIDDCEGLPYADRRRLATLVQSIFAKMIFVHGFVHCDPHPGNLLVTPAGALALLDHGIYRRLAPALRVDFSRLWLAVLAGDQERIKSCTLALGMAPEQWRFVALMIALAPGVVEEEGEARHPALLLGDGGEAAAAGLTAQQRAEAARKLLAITGGMEAQSSLFESIPKDLLLVLKTNNLLRHVNERMGTPVNRFRVMQPFAVRGAEERVGLARAVRLSLGTTVAPLLRKLERWRAAA